MNESNSNMSEANMDPSSHESSYPHQNPFIVRLNKLNNRYIKIETTRNVNIQEMTLMAWRTVQARYPNGEIVPKNGQTYRSMMKLAREVRNWEHQKELIGKANTSLSEWNQLLIEDPHAYAVQRKDFEEMWNFRDIEPTRGLHLFYSGMELMPGMGLSNVHARCKNLFRLEMGAAKLVDRLLDSLSAFEGDMLVQGNALVQKHAAEYLLKKAHGFNQIKAGTRYPDNITYWVLGIRQKLRLDTWSGNLTAAEIAGIAAEITKFIRDNIV